MQAGGGTRERPKIYDYVVDGSRAHVINFATAEASLLLQEAGLGSCPCGNPECAGEGGMWKTTPTRWSFKTSAPSIVLGADGLPAPDGRRRQQV